MVNRILLARFDIDMAGLDKFEVATMKFRPYQDVLDEFLGKIRKLRNNERFENYHYPPIRQLNSVLTGSAPMLVHGFEKVGYTEWYGDKSRMKFEERQMLALVKGAQGNPIWKPDIEQLNDLIAVWATEWFKRQFSDEVESRSAGEILRDLNQGIRAVSPIWKPIQAAGLWLSGNSIKYDALPSIISAEFVNRMEDNSYLLNDEFPLHWRLTEEGAKRLAVISEPNLHQGNRPGLFSYKLEFVLQTQAGRENPWVAVYIRIRRWADRQVSSVNYRRKISVMTTLQSERKPGWKFTPTMIRLRVAKNARDYYWTEDEQELLQAWQARDLVDPNDLFSNPAAHLSSENGEDTYHILHSEGISYKGARTHTMNTGTSHQERVELMQHITDVMQGILTPDTSMLSDMGSNITPEQAIDKHLLPMYSFDDLNKSGAILPVRSPRKEVKSVQRQMMLEALACGSGGKHINIILVAPEAPAQRVMEREVRRLLFLDDDEPLPTGIQISYIAPNIHHLAPPATELPLYPSKKEIKEKKYQPILDQAWKEKVKEWEVLLKPYANDGMCNLALIEIAEHERSEWLKRAIRRACVNMGVLSQMLMTIPQDFEHNPDWHKNPKLRGQIGRIRNGIMDLLLRQMNVLYGLPTDIYKYAGLPEEEAENLVIVGLYRHKKNSYNKPRRVDLPLAVELHPDGRVMVVLPNENGNPQEPILYTEAATQIGRLLASGQQDYYQLGNENITRFAEAILTQKRENAVLMLFEADGWRSGILPILKNDELAQVLREDNHYQLPLGKKVYTYDTLSNVRMLRLRDEGTLGETPQYVAARSDGSTSWEDWSDYGDPTTMFGAIDLNASAALFHYFSIGRQLQAAKSDNEDVNELYTYGEGGDVAFRHQQAVEIVPFFLQPGDDPLVYCRISHFLRSSPAWKGGNTTLPYPLHLAHKLLEDQMDVFGPKIYA